VDKTYRGIQNVQNVTSPIATTPALNMVGIGGRNMAGGKKVGLRTVLIPVFGMLALFAVGATAFAHAGSTGGTIAKTNKSISGGAEAEQPTQKPHRALQQSTRSKIFVNPTINNIRVDGCMKWGPVDCGSPAATHWCRSKGFERATDWSTEKVHPTIFQDPQSSVKVCDYFFCGAFARIACE
jgi:hypothetical protein